MYLCDAHTHSSFSFDGHCTVDEMCAAAVSEGIDELVVTDHYDANIISIGFAPDFKVREARDALCEAAKKYRGRLRVSCGVELGEPHELPERTRDFLEGNSFDFVIGSLHNLRTSPDFYFLDYTKMNDTLLDIIWRMYLDETAEMIEFGGFDTLGHLGYPVRYIREAGMLLDPGRYRDRVAEIFELLIKKDIALEVNTSGLVRRMADTMPSNGELELYRRMGGRLLTIGSDAHNAGSIGQNIRTAHKLLRDIGFREFTVFYDRVPEQKEL